MNTKNSIIPRLPRSLVKVLVLGRILDKRERKSVLQTLQLFFIYIYIIYKKTFVFSFFRDLVFPSYSFSQFYVFFNPFCLKPTFSGGVFFSLILILKGEFIRTSRVDPLGLNGFLHLGLLFGFSPVQIVVIIPRRVDLTQRSPYGLPI